MVENADIAPDLSKVGVATNAVKLNQLGFKPAQAQSDISDDDPLDEGVGFFMKYGYPSTPEQNTFAKEFMKYSRGIRKTKSLKSIVFEALKQIPMIILLFISRIS